MKYLRLLPLLLLLIATSALSIRQDAHQLQTMNPTHFVGIPQYKGASYSNGVVTTTFSIEYAFIGMGKINTTYNGYCSYSKKCGTIQNYPCCFCEVPQSISIIGPYVPPSLISAMDCATDYVKKCLTCRRACGLLDIIGANPSEDRTVCQSSSCTSNPQYNRTDCGTA